MIKKVNIGISQKINLGNYETRDYSISVDATIEEGESVEKTVKELRDYCLKETQDYYNSVKGVEKEELNKIEPEYLKIEAKIKEITDEEELRKYAPVLQEIKDKTVRLTLQRAFNLKLMSIKK